MPLSRSLAITQPFKYRDFSYLFVSEICFFIPAWMAAMVFGLIATHIKGNSPFYVGLIGFGFNIPMLFGPFIGVIVDRSSRIKIMRAVSLTGMLAALIMALLLIGKLPNFWVMLALVLVYGFSNAFYYPSIMTGAHDIIDQPHVTGNAVSIINTTNRVVMFFGYALGGLFVTYFNEQFCYWFNAALYILSFFILCQIKINVPLPTSKKSVIAELKASFSYLRSSRPIYAVIILLGLQGFLAWPYLFQIPVVNRFYLDGTPATLGFLLAIGGVGGTIGGLVMAMRKSSLYLTRYLLGATLIVALSLIFLSFCRTVALAATALFLLDFGLLMALTVGAIFIQNIVPKSFQGRIMGIYSMVSFGTIPLGSVIFYGGIGEPFGVMMAFATAAIIIFLTAMWYFTQIPKIRREATPVYIERGLLKNQNNAKKI